MLGLYDDAEAILATDPSAILSEGKDEMLLHCATFLNHPDAVQWILDHGGDVNIMVRLWDCPHTPMHCVAEFGLVEVAAVLLKANPDLSLCDGNHNSTPLGWAKHSSHPEVEELIASHLGKDGSAA